MATLKNDWLTDGLIDFEYKKYILLAYLQDTAKIFDERKLYPRLAELVEHYRHLQHFKTSKQTFANELPKEISRFDLENFKVQYKSMFEDDELLKEIDEIVEFALPHMHTHLCLGRELHEEVEEKVEVFPVGIIPLRNEEGYFFLSDFQQRLVNVYYYLVTVFENVNEKFRGVHTRFLFSYKLSLTKTYEEVKSAIIRQEGLLAAPATYAVEFKESFPLPETMLPVAKRMLVRYIGTA